MKMTIAREDGDIVNVAVAGAITQRELNTDTDPLGELLGPAGYARKVMLDLGNVSYLDSSGVGWLLKCHKRMRQQGGRMVLHSFSPVVSNTIRVLKLEKVLDIAETVDAANLLARGGVTQ